MKKWKGLKKKDDKSDSLKNKKGSYFGDYDWASWLTVTIALLLLYYFY